MFQYPNCRSDESDQGIRCGGSSRNSHISSTDGTKMMTMGTFKGSTPTSSFVSTFDRRRSENVAQMFNYFCLHPPSIFYSGSSSQSTCFQSKSRFSLHLSHILVEGIALILNIHNFSSSFVLCTGLQQCPIGDVVNCK